MVWWGVVLTTVVLCAPVLLAILNDRRIASFQGYSFGHLRKAGRNFRIMTWAIFAFYAGIVVSDLMVGALPKMWREPTSAEGAFLHLRIGVAGVAYGFAVMVSQELYRATQAAPGQPKLK